jgi:hypothetical protein
MKIDLIEDDLSRAKRGLMWLRLEESLHEAGKDSNCPDCPICLQVEKSEKHYLESMLYEYVLDVGVRKKLHNEHGFCSRHAKLAFEAEKKLKSDGLHLATMFETVLEEHISILNDQLKALESAISDKRKKKKVPNTFHVSKCSICDFVEETEQIALHAFLYFSNDTELTETYDSSHAVLCFKHVEMLVKEQVNPQVIMITQRKLVRIKKDLSNFISKHDYQSLHDYSEGELHSYVAAVKFLAGEYRR